MMAETLPTLEWHFPASVEQIDVVCRDFYLHVKDVCSEDDCFFLQILARESLNNAVIHGCGSDIQRMVSFQVWQKSEFIFMRIEDDGPGFEWKACLDKTLAPVDQDNGRGLALYRMYADQIEFNSAGNCVTLGRKIDLA